MSTSRGRRPTHPLGTLVVVLIVLLSSCHGTTTPPPQSSTPTSATQSTEAAQNTTTESSTNPPITTTKTSTTISTPTSTDPATSINTESSISSSTISSTEKITLKSSGSPPTEAPPTAHISGTQTTELPKDVTGRLLRNPVSVILLNDAEQETSASHQDLLQVPELSAKPGRCPTRILAPELCPEDVADQCAGDDECAGTGKCCSTGCARVCVRPMSSACELQRENTLRRGRTLGLPEEALKLPSCDMEGGTFVSVQCHGTYCYCADPYSGYEMPGTRAPSLREVNCSNPRPCAGYQCRMLCPYQFELDHDGCPLCKCRDPCQDVQCPSGSACALEETPCATEPCPPLPTCKQPRSLHSLCPLGAPLMLDEAAQRPFLCGSAPGQPTCPPLYKCHVTPGLDYGACCADVDTLIKPGSCPIDAIPPKSVMAKKDASLRLGNKKPSPDALKKDELLLAEMEALMQQEAEELRCGVACSHDLQCPSTQKCCLSAICGQHCIQPANLTECLHQRMIAELMIVSEREGRGYIPQCSERTGLYVPRQCSRNGLVCWCVDETGNRKTRTLGPAEEVHCDDQTLFVSSRSSCPPVHCSLPCEYGYRSDELGCSVCECEHPCEDVKCPKGERCVLKEECGRGGCSPAPVCEDFASEERSVSGSSMSPTAYLSASSSPVSSSVVSLLPTTHEEEPTEPHHVDRSGEAASYASENASQEASNPGGTFSPHPDAEYSEAVTPVCPLMLEPLSVGGLLLQCDDHNPCPADHFCTAVGPRDGVGLAPYCCPMPKRIESTKPGKCPFLGSANDALCSATSVCSSDDHCAGPQKCCVVPACGGPVCVEVGPHQNDSMDQVLLQGPTMCEYLRDLSLLEGVELAIATPNCDADGAYEQVQCNALGQCWCVDDFGSAIPGTKVSSRSLVACDRLRESLSCGEVLCRLGCDYGFQLDPDTACPLCHCRDPCEDVDCGAGLACELVDIPCVDGICPPIPQCVPIPQREGEAVTCPRGEPYTIPGTNTTLSCSPRSRALECPRGYACLAQENEVDGICCYAAADPEGKVGQCPYLVPAVSQACDLECSNDAHCEGTEKCCSNGCGMHCVDPIIKTACQHQRTLLEHRAREASIPAGRVYLPKCGPQGEFLATQCHPATTTCWCVDQHGLEVPGTRVSQPAVPNCQAPAPCPDTPCDLACLHGRALDGRGCPTCACRDPCEEVQCSEPQQECRIVHVACVGEPCPPLPVCLPKLDNPCPTGTPLSVNGSMVQCGPEGSVCPSTHKCHLSPLGEYALCCRKPREVCYEPRDSGFCEGSIRRWHFDPESNACRSFRFGGCGGNLNNFESEVECRNACPVLSSCEKMRAKNLQKAEKNNKMTFIPKCEKGSGAWLSQQCLEQLGVCWCVTPDGKQVEGSLTRGSPQCGDDQSSGRKARRLNIAPVGGRPTNALCDAEQAVHVCDKSLCDDKICLAHPAATCRINPCGGCSLEFVAEDNTVVDCNQGLSRCQQDLQAVLNSATYSADQTGLSSYADREAAFYDLVSNADVYHSQSPAPLRDFEDGAQTFLSQPQNFEGLYSILRSTQGSPRDIHDERERGESKEIEALGLQRGDRRSRKLDLTVSGDVVEEARRASRSVVEEPSSEQPHSTRQLDDFVAMDDSASTLTGRQTLIEEDYPTTDLSVKPGTCPGPSSDVSLLTCEPRQECLQDNHCQGSAKCCFTGCGSSCLQPQEVPASSQGLSVTVPLCERDGSYARTQTAQGWAWCVNSKGQPLDYTLTKGHVRCGPNGQILEQVSQGPVCPYRPGVAPRVCRDQCLHASCAAHPDALCVADPCNSCRVSFFSPSGEHVHCEERCSQPLASGMCRSSFRRYFHNASSGQCEEFVYGGCQGNDNNFVTIEDCQQHCNRIVSPCSLPLRPGHCSGSEARWYYNSNRRSCEPFVYSSCDGNTNNFLSKKHCEETCPELVLCPYWSSASMEPEPCSRTAACFNQTCHGYPSAVCTVNPCTCQTLFTDMRGQPVACHQPTQPPKTILAFSYDQDLPDELSAEELSGSEGPITLYLEGEPSLGRCELLRQHLAKNTGSRRYQPQCDQHGHFLPTQCYTGVYVHNWPSEEKRRPQHVPSDVTPRCWCVDETGKKTHPSAFFLKGQRQCDHVLVESVVVTLGFHGHKLGLDGLGRRHEKEIREQMAELLESLRPAAVDGSVNIVDLPDVTQVKFTLRGDNKIDAAYKLEDKVRKGELALLLTEEGAKRVPADMRASWFHHQVAPPAWRLSTSRGNAFGSDAAAAREVVEQMETAEPPFLAASVVITVLSASLLCALVVAVVLYRRHVAGNYPKATHGSMQSLAFSDASLDRRSISSAKFCSQLEHPKLDGRVPVVTTIEDEFRAVTRH